MNRRIAIRNMALILGSVAVLPSCLNDKKGKPVVALKHLDIDADQENLVTNLAQTILPKTATPGSSELGINLFIFKMIDDCVGKEQQEDFLAGLKDFDDEVDKVKGKSFNELSPAERTAYVTDFEKAQKALQEKHAAAAKADKNYKWPEPTKQETFYNMTKGYTVFGYTTSKYFMTEQVKYELVPGRYNAMFQVKKKATA